MAGITVIARRSTAVTITAPLSHRMTQKDKNGKKVTGVRGSKKAKEPRVEKPTDVSSLQVENLSVTDKNIVCGRQ